MIQEVGTGPQLRLSSEPPRSSPSRNHSPDGSWAGTGKLHSWLPPHGAANGSFCGVPLRTTLPSSTAIVSPGPATTRFTKIWLVRSGVACGQTSPPGLATPQTGESPVAPAGALIATMSPICGSDDE